MTSNSIAKGYSTIAELPTEVRSSFDETDQEKWMNEYNSIIGDKTDEESIKQAREDAWMKMQDCPSGLSVETWGSVEVKDWDNEVVDIKSLEERCDTFIAHGGRLNDVHTNLPVGAVWKWEKATHPETGQEGVKFWFNVYRDTETTERAREEILEGIKRSVSIGAEAPRGEYKCDEKGCYVERNVTDFYELSICESPANPEANFIAINGENIAKSKHHNKGDMVFKLNDMTVHEDYTTCPIQNIKRNLIKSGIKDTHIGKDNHIIAKGLTRAQLLKALKESDTTCKYRETSPGEYEIKVVKSKDTVKKDIDVTPEDVDYAIKVNCPDAYELEWRKLYGHHISMNGFANGFVYAMLSPHFNKPHLVEQYIHYLYELYSDEMKSARKSIKKDLFWSSDDGDNYHADGCKVEYNEDTDGYTATVYGNGDSDKIVREFDALDDAKAFCEDYCGKSFRKGMNEDIDPNADIQQYIDEAIANGWAYESNKCVFFTKDVPEGFFKDQYERGNVQCISSYWGFRNDIVAKDK